MPRILVTLPEDVRGLLSANDGLFRLGQARQGGIFHGRIRRLVEAQLLTRVGDGIYVSAQEYQALDGWERFHVRSRAISIAYAKAFLTGWSAISIWRLPTIGYPPRLPLALEPKQVASGSSVTPNGRILVGGLMPHHRWQIGSIKVREPSVGGPQCRSQITSAGRSDRRGCSNPDRRRSGRGRAVHASLGRYCPSQLGCPARK
jgi:hypothetical protein